MSEILVLVDHAEGPEGVSVKKPTYEMLTLAARLGEPSAVFIGPKDQGSEVAAAVKKYGAGTVYVVDDEDLKGYLVAPKAEALQQVMEKSGQNAGPGAVLITSSAEGKEIAGRLAIKTESGLITDAVDVEAASDGGDSSGHDPVGVRGQLHGQGEGHQGHADHHREAELRRPCRVRWRAARWRRSR